MNNKNKTLTPEQELLIPIYAQKWEKIAFSTAEIDYLKAGETVKAIYNILELLEPNLYFYDSPLAAAQQIKKQEKNLIYSPVFARLRSLLYDIIFKTVLQAYESQFKIRNDYLYFSDRVLLVNRLLTRRDSYLMISTGIYIEECYIFSCAFNTYYLGEGEIFIDYCLEVLNSLRSKAEGRRQRAEGQTVRELNPHLCLPPKITNKVRGN